MRSLVWLVFCVALLPCISANGQSATAPATSYYLVELSGDPNDQKAVVSTLRMALALREDRSKVTLFVDLEAVALAKPSSDSQSPELPREIDELVAKLKSAGIRVLVCPHCAELRRVSAASLRAGWRFTSKEELEQERTRADKIYEYQPAADPPGGASPAVEEDRVT